MKIEVYSGSDEVSYTFEADLQFTDYSRLHASIGDRRETIHELRRLLEELETARGTAAATGEVDSIDKEIPVSTVVARWAGYHQSDEITIEILPSQKLDLVLAAIEATFPAAEIKLL